MVTNILQPHLFSNYLHDPNIKPPFPHTTTIPLFKAILASCAAPGYFPLVLSGTTHLDGALVANNPAQLALLESKLLWPKEKLQCLASLGSGLTDFHEHEKKNISTKDVLTRSLNALADTETAHQVLKHFLDSERYFRLSPSASAECCGVK